MTSSTLDSLQCIQNSQTALSHGDKLLTRYWARKAIELDQECEEAWLLLAAVACPQASIGYLKRALEVNPRSQRAYDGMIWALKRAPAVTQITSAISESSTVSSPEMVIGPSLKLQKSAIAIKKPDNLHISIFFLVFLIIALLAFSIWNVSSVLAFFSPVSVDHAPAWAQVNIVKETTTITPAAINTATHVPTKSPLLTETPIPSPTALSTDLPISGQTTSFVPSELPDQSNALIYAGNKWVLVDISEQHMYVYEGNNIIYSFVASTGINNGTRTGTFAVQSKIPNAYGATWNIWMPEWLGIYWSGGLENGIHALPILADGATLWAGYLGTPISYGCVVLNSYEAQLLYNWAEIGTPVIIQR